VLLRLIFPIVLLVVVVDVVQAQSGPIIQAGIAYDRGALLALDRTQGVANPYVGAAGDGSSSERYVWLGAGIEWSDLIGGWLGFRATAHVGTQQGEFISDSVAAGTGQGAVDPVVGSFGIQTSSTVALIEADVTAHLPFNLSLALGPWVSPTLSFSARRSTNGGEYSADGGYYDIGINRYEIPAGKDLAPGLRKGLGLTLAWQARLSSIVDIRPELRARMDVDALNDGLGLRSMSVGAGLSLLFDPARDTVGGADTHDASAPVPSYPPEISLNLLGGSGGHELVVREESTRHLRTIPFRPLVIFDSASTHPAYASPRGDALLTRGDLARMEPRGIYDRMLDVIGLRLREHPDAKIEVVGSVLRGEPASLADARAEAVRSYLADVWGIDQARITSSHAGGSPGRSAVAIRSASPAITAPVENGWIEVRPTASPIGVAVNTTSSTGIRRWKLDLWFGREVIERYAGTGGKLPDSLAPVIPLDSYGAVDRLPALVAEVQVIDSSGRVGETRSELPIRRVRRATDRVDSEAFTVIVPDGPAEETEGMIDRVAGNLAAGARVVIATDAGLTRAPGAASALASRVGGRIREEAARRGVKLSGIDTATPIGDTGDTIRNAPWSAAVRVTVLRGGQTSR
jgi:hypothetical protein